MEDQEKQANTVSKVVILVGCAFAALFVAMVVVMAVRASPTWVGESDYNVSYTMSPTASPVAFIPLPGASESGRVRYEQVFQEAPVSTSYRFTIDPSGTSYRFHGTPFSSSYTFMGAPYGASFEFSRPAVYYHMSTGEETVTWVDPKEKKK